MSVSVAVAVAVAILEGSMMNNENKNKCENDDGMDEESRTVSLGMLQRALV